MSKLKAYRESLGLSLVEAARQISEITPVSASTLSRLEQRGKGGRLLFAIEEWSGGQVRPGDIITEQNDA